MQGYSHSVQLSVVVSFQLVVAAAVFDAALSATQDLVVVVVKRVMVRLVVERQALHGHLGLEAVKRRADGVCWRGRASQVARLLQHLQHEKQMCWAHPS
jgi:hypothetical protein